MANLGKMRFTLEDIKRQFDTKSYTLGLAYAQKKRVVQIQRMGNLIRSKVNETANTAYQQNIFIKSTTSGIQFQGTCSCPEVLNCHHVASVLLSIVRQNELQSREASMHSPLASWVHKLYLAARPDSPEALAAEAAEHDSPEKLLFILSPDPADRRIFMSLCRVRMKRNGQFASITAVSDLNALLMEKPACLHDGNTDAVRLFAALYCGMPPSSTVTALPQGHLGGRLIEILMARRELYWANTREDIGKGLFFPLEMSSEREADLFWDEAGTKLRLRWRFAQATGKRRSSGAVDYILPTEPAWYIDNLSSGKLALPGRMAGMTVMGIHEIVTHMPVVPVGNRRIVSRLLAETKASGELYIFKSRKGINRPISRSRAYSIFSTVSFALSDVEKFSCHSLRKTFGYHAWKSGTSSVMLMTIYNHSSFSITKRYLGIDQQEKDLVYDSVLL